MKKILFVGLCLAGFAFFTSSQKRFSPPTVEQVREFILYTGVSKEKGKVVPYPCNSSPAMIYYTLVQAIDRDHQEWYQPETYFIKPDFQNNFKALFGLDPIAKKVKMPQNTDNRNHTFKFFDPTALQAAFDQLYVKPEADIQGLAYQKIYDISFKEYFKESAEIIAIVLKDKELFNQLAKEYFKKATEDKDFNALRLIDQYVQDHFGSNYGPPYSKFNRIFSIMLRRDADGSLSVMLSCFKTVLKDYDKETFEKYENLF